MVNPEENVVVPEENMVVPEENVVVPEQTGLRLSSALFVFFFFLTHGGSRQAYQTQLWRDRSSDLFSPVTRSGNILSFPALYSPTMRPIFTLRHGGSMLLTLLGVNTLFFWVEGRPILPSSDM